MSIPRKITENTARRRFAANQPFIICPCNLRLGTEWHPEYHVTEETILAWKEKADARNFDSAWNLFYNNWSHYNTDEGGEGNMGTHGSYYVSE